jgi:putative resolvase
MNDYVKPSIAAKHFGVSVQRIRAWELDGKIDCIRVGPGGHRRYNIQSLKNSSTSAIQSSATIELESSNSNSESYCYCRVSSSKQKDDLVRQQTHLQSIYPTHKVITDIGSGLNFKRKGLLTLLEKATSGLVKEIVVAHRDRLCRFGFDLILWILNKHKVKLVVLSDDKLSPDEELSNDLLSIIHVFSCRANGKRKYVRKQVKESSEEENEDSSEGG